LIKFVTNSLKKTGTFLTIKYFLLAAEAWQEKNGKELENLSIVVTGSETGKFGQAGHTEYASGKAGLQYGLVRGVKNEIIRLNRKARINAVAPGWIDTPMNYGRLDDPHEFWVEAQATYVKSMSAHILKDTNQSIVSPWQSKVSRRMLPGLWHS
jgi:NAD(P)-dependent dehydrogenase (short-subunit alcohol dehydrogenase family)